jgi:hypothetical protein
LYIIVFFTDPTIWVSKLRCSRVTFDGVQTTIYGENVGLSSPINSITGEPLLRGGGVVDVSTAFADDVLDAHSEAMATNSNSTTADTEIGGQTYGTGTHHFESSINVATGTVTLDGNGDFNNPVSLHS